MNFIKGFSCIYWDDLLYSWFCLYVVLHLLICYVEPHLHPCIPGMKPKWSWCVIFLTWCWIHFVSISLIILYNYLFSLSLSLCILVWYWNEWNICCLFHIMSIMCSFHLYFMEIFWVLVLVHLKCMAESIPKSIRSWAFLCWETLLLLQFHHFC
jgi:hypothetical protein